MLENVVSSYFLKEKELEFGECGFRTRRDEVWSWDPFGVKKILFNFSFYDICQFSNIKKKNPPNNTTQICKQISGISSIYTKTKICDEKHKYHIVSTLESFSISMETISPPNIIEAATNVWWVRHMLVLLSCWCSKTRSCLEVYSI